jgi:peptidoglycan/LPS O-acetylase OafA/YrhL
MAALPQPGLELNDTRTTLADGPLPVPLIHSSRRLPELDGLRGVAVAVVVIYHAALSDVVLPHGFSWLVAAGKLGWSGVDLFFVLSGFLIGGILLDSRSSANYFKTFYLRRAYRILPIYLVLMIFFSMRFIHVSAGPLGDFSGSAIPLYAYCSFTQNIWMAFLGTLGAGVVGPTWSLAVEEQFYLTAPLVVRKLAPEKLARVLVGVVIAAPLLRIALYAASRHNGVAEYVSMPCRADALSLGILSAWVARSPRWWNFLLARGRALKTVAGVFFLGMIVMTPWGGADERGDGHLRVYVAGRVLHFDSADRGERGERADQPHLAQPESDATGRGLIFCVLVSPPVDGGSAQGALATVRPGQRIGSLRRRMVGSWTDADCGSPVLALVRKTPSQPGP